MLQNYSVSLLNVYSNPEKVYFLYMNKGDIFLNDVRDITLAQLKIVADKTGELFIQAMPDRIDRNKIYLWLLDNYEMNEVQELAACFIRLYNKDFEDGSFMFTEPTGWTAETQSSVDMWHVEFNITYSKINVTLL